MDGGTVQLSIPSLRQYRFEVLTSPGDGNCFFHSLCRAFYVSYLTENLEGAHLSRFDIVKRLRSELASELASVNPRDPLGRSYYSSIGGGALESIGRETEEFKLQTLKDHLDSSQPVGEVIVNYASLRLSKSIYLIDSRTRDLYVTTEIPEEQPSIILWYTPEHYDLLGLREAGGQIITHFSPQHPVILLLRRRLLELKKGPSDLPI